jgi:hypothetical protein
MAQNTHENVVEDRIITRLSDVDIPNLEFLTQTIMEEICPNMCPDCCLDMINFLTQAIIEEICPDMCPDCCSDMITSLLILPNIEESRGSDSENPRAFLSHGILRLSRPQSTRRRRRTRARNHRRRGRNSTNGRNNNG